MTTCATAKITFISALVWLLLVLASTADAELRWSFRDDEVVNRAELIVVGHLRPGTIKYVPHPKLPSGGMSWEHHAALAVTEVLKGQADQKEVPIVIHYGLDPLVGGQLKIEGGTRMNIQGLGRNYPPESIQIMDTGNSSLSFEPLVPDAREDHLWFLRRQPPRATPGPPYASQRLGIYDPEDLQSISLKSYFLAYLSSDPEKAVRKQLVENPAVGRRALRYLQHQEVQRIITDPDPARRAERLLPYFLSRCDDQDDIRKALIECGQDAGPCLLAVFDQIHEELIQSDILRLFGDIGYRGCVERLIKLLEDADRHFAWATTQPGWEPSKAFKTDHMRYYRQTYSGVYALGQISDPRSREIIERVRDRWSWINCPNPQIVKACEFALQRLPGTAPAP
jgi:hypothetical protein